MKRIALPLRGLYYPALPYRCHGKLMFLLCRACVTELNQMSDCTHSNNDRQLSGVWVSFELQKAVEKGYCIVHIDEVWHFPNKTDTLFKDYVKTFLKCKQEASSYPGHVKTPEEQKKYRDDYFEKEGIVLESDQICVNKAVRSINTLLLNSLWGRFSMRSNLPTCELITEPARFTQLMFSDHYDVRQFCFISDDVAMVQWRHADGRASRTKDVNIFIGAMTTAHARLMLYELLDKLQQRVLYCDTDSIIFTSKLGEWNPPLGQYLGDLTNELNDGNVCGLPEEDCITEFVSGGPKCYAYCTAWQDAGQMQRSDTTSHWRVWFTRLWPIRIQMTTLWLYLKPSKETRRGSISKTTQLQRKYRLCITNAENSLIIQHSHMATRSDQGFDARLQHPFSLVVSSPSNFGKTFFVKSVIENASRVISHKIDNIVYIYSCWQPLYNQLL